jgi:hypothetical protein
MAKKKSKKGGPREGSGRKPVDDKAIPFTIYLRESLVDEVGRDKLKEIFLKAAEREYKKLK